MIRKRHIGYFGFAAAVLGIAAAFYSCSDDEMSSSSGFHGGDGAIAFDMSTVELKNMDAETRAAMSPTRHEVYKMVDRDTFYMKISNSPQIALSKTLETTASTRSGSTPVTRSVIYSDNNFRTSVENMLVYCRSNDASFAETVNQSDNWMTTENNWERSASTLDFWAIAPYNAAYIKNASGEEPTKSDVPSSTKDMPKYKITADGTSTPDILFAKSDQMQGSNYVNVNLKFRHILACVALQSGLMRRNMQLKSITFNDIITKATYEPQADGTDKWVLPKEGDADYEGSHGDVTINLNNTQTTGHRVQRFTTDDTYAFLIPQSLAGKQIVLTYYDLWDLDGNNNPKEYTLTYTMPGNAVELKGGCTNWCTISTQKINSTFTLEVKVDGEDNKTKTGDNGISYIETTVPYLGGSKNIVIDSYSTKGLHGGEVTQEYVTEFSTQDPTKGNVEWHNLSDVPSAKWILDEPRWTDGDKSITTEMNFGRQTPTTVDIIAKMKNKAVQGSETDYLDLSTHDNFNFVASDIKPRTTANCYVVSYPGYYKFPLIYGSCVKDGKVSIDHTWDISRQPRESNANKDFRIWFPDNTGHEMNSASILKGLQTNKATVTNLTAEVLWEYPEKSYGNRIQNVTVVDAKADDDNPGYIQFYVPQNEIRPGNAVIVLKGYITYKDRYYDYAGYSVTAKRTAVLWSWHIWFLDSQRETEPGHEDWLNYPLGWSPHDGQMITYPQGEIWMRVKQLENDVNNGKDIVDGQDVKKDGNGYRYVHFIQEPSEDTPIEGHVPYYQFGRKDPFMVELMPGGNTKYGDANHIPFDAYIDYDFDYRLIKGYADKARNVTLSGLNGKNYKDYTKYENDIDYMKTFQTKDYKIKYQMLDISPISGATSTDFHPPIENHFLNPIREALEHPDVAYSTFERVNRPQWGGDTWAILQHPYYSMVGYVYTRAIARFDDSNEYDGSCQGAGWEQWNPYWTDDTQLSNDIKYYKTVNDPCPPGYRLPAREFAHDEQWKNRGWISYGTWVPGIWGWNKRENPYGKLYIDMYPNDGNDENYTPTYLQKRDENLWWTSVPFASHTLKSPFYELSPWFGGLTNVDPDDENYFANMKHGFCELRTSGQCMVGDFTAVGDPFRTEYWQDALVPIRALKDKDVLKDEKK